MRKRLADVGQENGTDEDQYDKSSKRRDETSIVALMVIAFVLAAGYLYMFGNEEYSGPSNNNVRRGVESAASASTGTVQVAAKAPTLQRPPDLKPGCLWTIPEVDEGRHIVKPPPGPVDLVCCETTKGIWNIAVRAKKLIY